MPEIMQPTLPLSPTSLSVFPLESPEKKGDYVTVIGPTLLFRTEGYVHVNIQCCKVQTDIRPLAEKKVSSFSIGWATFGRL